MGNGCAVRLVGNISPSPSLSMAALWSSEASRSPPVATSLRVLLPNAGPLGAISPAQGPHVLLYPAENLH